jgi:cyclohexanecarboxylate-CoA ligase
MGSNEVLTGARTMWELVERRADASPDQPMLIAADGETITFGAFRDRAARAAAGLHDMGVRTESVVSWQLPTRIDTVVLSLALSRLGAIQNPIIHLYREREVGFALRQTAASLFIIPDRVAGYRFFRPDRTGPRGCGREPAPPYPHRRARSPRGRPVDAAPAPHGSTARRCAHPLDLLHLGIDGGPQRGAAH